MKINEVSGAVTRANLPQNIAVALAKLTYQQKLQVADYLQQYQQVQAAISKLDPVLQQLLRSLAELPADQLQSANMLLSPTWREKQQARKDAYWDKRGGRPVAK